MVLQRSPYLFRGIPAQSTRLVTIKHLASRKASQGACMSTKQQTQGTVVAGSATNEAWEKVEGGINLPEGYTLWTRINAKERIWTVRQTKEGVPSPGSGGYFSIETAIKVKGFRFEVQSAPVQPGEKTVDEITLPAYWANALVNGDYSGLEFSDPTEAQHCRNTVAGLASEGWQVVSLIEDSARFTWHYQFYNTEANVSGGEVCDYVIHKV